MSRKILVDTNILLDAAMDERLGWASAVLLMDEIAYEDVEAYVSPVSLKDVYYILTKYSDEASARGYIAAVLDLFTVTPVDSATCLMAVRSDEPDFEDGLIRACAEAAEVDFIISRDEKAFAKSSIKRLSAQDYIDLFCEVEEVDV